MPEVIKGTIYKPGSEWRSPLTKKVILKILKVTDGTPDTTFTRLVYGRYNRAKGDYVRDVNGKIPKLVQDHYLEGDPDPQKQNLLKTHKLLPGADGVIGDEKDKFVYYVQDPDVEFYDVKKTIEGKNKIQKRENYISGHAKCSHEEFLVKIQEVEAQIADETTEAEALAKEQQATIAAMTADAIVNKIKTGKSGAKKKAKRAK